MFTYGICTFSAFIYCCPTRFLYHSLCRLIAIRRVSLVEQELPTLPEYLSLLSVFCGFVLLNAQNVLFSLQCFVDHCLSLFLLTIALLIYDFGFPFLYLQSFLTYYYVTIKYIICHPRPFVAKKLLHLINPFKFTLFKLSTGLVALCHDCHSIYFHFLLY